MTVLSNSLSSLRRNTAARLSSTWHVTFVHHPDRGASWHQDDHSRRMLLRVSPSFPLPDHALHADMLHEISWRVFACCPAGGCGGFSSAPPSVLLSYSRFPLPVVWRRHEVTRIQEIQPPALSGCLLTGLCMAASDCNPRGDRS